MASVQLLLLLWLKHHKQKWVMEESSLWFMFPEVEPIRWQGTRVGDCSRKLRNPSSILNTKQKEQTGSGIRMWTIKVHPSNTLPSSRLPLLRIPQHLQTAPLTWGQIQPMKDFFFYLNHHGMHGMEYIVNDVHKTDSHSVCFSAHILLLCEMWWYWIWTHVSQTYWPWPSSEAEDILKMGENPISILESSSWSVESTKARGK